MKIVAGLGSVDDYETFAEAGADEFFIGYVPLDYMLKFGRRQPLNRREVIYYNVQAGSESELLILRKMQEKRGLPVALALNALCYTGEQLDYIENMLSHCAELGFNRVIAAAPELIERLAKNPEIFITVSGEYAELNSFSVEKLECIKNIKRIIFPRQTAITEMQRLTRGKIEYEAFALNEKCHFTGAYCRTVHCDELCHMCRVPYRLSEPSDNLKNRQESLECGIEHYDGLSEYMIGESGCALCSLWKLRAAGVTHLKVVSRGNRSEDTAADIRALKQALDILENSDSEEFFIKEIKKTLFPSGCSGNCYY